MAANSSDAVVIKAGIMTVEGKKVKPDTRKGLIKIASTDMDAALFQWIDVSNDNKIDDELYLTSDSEFKKVAAPGRIYVLEMKSWDVRKYFWLQEPDREKDEEFCKQINDAIQSKSVGPDAEMEESNDTVEPSLGQGAMGGLPGTNQDQQALFQQLLAGMQNFQQNRSSETPGLSTIVTNEAVEKMISDPQYFDELKEHLPEGYQHAEGFKESIRSPQFRQALDALSSAVNSEQITAVITSLGLDTSVIGQSSDGIDALVKALEKDSEAKRKTEEDNSAAEKKEEQSHRTKCREDGL